MIILDLSSEQTPVWSKTKSYFGKWFIWCLLHNYGGIRGVYGPMDVVATSPVDVLLNPSSTMIGTGLTMEAIEHNPVIYDLMVRIRSFLLLLTLCETLCTVTNIIYDIYWLTTRFS